jgi:Icc-related predicted phosphoesterase
MRIVFATDIHGSEQCFRKFLNSAKVYRADVMILGGDITGKVLVPIVHRPGTWTAFLAGKEMTAETEQELRQLRQLIRLSGQYAVIVAPDEKAALDSDEDLRHQAFRDAMLGTVGDWVELAAERLEPQDIPVIAMPGNDDWHEVEDALEKADYITSAEGKTISLPDDYTLVSYGYSNKTPWDSPRELDDQQLGQRLRALVDPLDDLSRTIYNFHVPPFGTSLDQAPALSADFKPRSRGGQIEMTDAGSPVVREIIERTQPLLGIFGHIHESKGMEKLGRTVCINPGSEYGTGMLRLALIELRKDKVRSWQLITG